MFKFLIFLFIALYFSTIFKAIKEFHDINRIIRFLSNYLNSARLSKSGYDIVGYRLETSPDYEHQLRILLTNYPLISKYLISFNSQLQYGAPDIDNYRSAISLYDSICMELNFARQNIKDSLNPFNTLKILFSLPCHLLGLLGLNTTAFFGNILNVFAWSIPILADLYHDEARAFIDYLLEFLTSINK